MGEYFADFDAPTGLWCVFHTDINTGHAYSSWADENAAKHDAERRNGVNTP